MSTIFPPDARGGPAGPTEDETAAELLEMARGGGLNIVGTVLSQASMFLVVAMLAVFEGSAGVGRYSQAFAVLVIMSLFALVGFQTTLTRFVAFHRAEQDEDTLRGTIRLGVAFPTLVATALGVALYLTADQIAAVLGQPVLASPLRYVSVALPFSVYMKTALAATQGFKSMREFVGVSLILEPGTRLVVTGVLLLAGYGLSGAMLALVSSNVLGAVLAWRALRRRIRHLAQSVGHPRYQIRALARFTVVTWVASLATNALLWADVLIIGVLLQAEAVGVYQVATRVVTLATFVMVPITSAFAPRMADFYRRGRFMVLHKTYGVATSWIVRLSLPAFVVLIIFPYEVLAVFGGEFAGAAIVTVILAVGKLVDAFTGPCGMMLNMSDRPGLNAINNVVAVAGNIALNVLLIPQHGIVGAAWAWTITLVVLNVARLIEVGILLRMVPSDPGTWRALVAIAPAATAGYGLGLVLDGTAGLFAGGLTIGAVYAVLVAALGLTDEDRLIARDLRLGAFGAMRRRPSSVRLRWRVRFLMRRLSGRRETGLGPVPLARLISPLRFDIHVRVSFFEFVRDNLALYEDDVEEFVRRSHAHPYYVWFSKIAYPIERFSRFSGDDAQQAFRRRVHRSVALYRSVQREGFDVRQPVIVLTGDKILPTHTGKQIDQRFFSSDGCHRLALLWMQGYRTLPPEWYRVRRLHKLRPRDNTARMLGELTVSEEEYVSFLAPAYGVDDSVDVASLRARVAASAPERIPELERILDVDCPLLDSRGSSEGSHAQPPCPGKAAQVLPTVPDP